MQVVKCVTCQKLNPKYLQGYHVSQLCWCGAIKDGDKWTWSYRTVYPLFKSISKLKDAQRQLELMYD